MPEGTSVEIRKGSWPILPVFTVMEEIGNVLEEERYRTFNMGVGMVIVCSPSDAEAIKTHVLNQGEKCYQIGQVVKGEGQVWIR